MGITTTTATKNTNSNAESYHELQLEQENIRKKVKRLTGELDVLETYFSTFQTLFTQLPLPHDQLSKVAASITDSIHYMRDLFSASKLCVTQGKKVQRKVRYEKLKNEFTQLIAVCTAGKDNTHNTQNSANYENVQRKIEAEREDHRVKIEQYKEQVRRMRENIDIFKDNIRVIKEQNEELKLKQTPQQEVIELVEELKYDNARLADEVKKLQGDNFSLSTYMGVSRETIQQQNGIINNLKEVIDKLQQVQMHQNSQMMMLGDENYDMLQMDRSQSRSPSLNGNSRNGRQHISQQRQNLHNMSVMVQEQGLHPPLIMDRHSQHTPMRQQFMTNAGYLLKTQKQLPKGMDLNRSRTSLTHHHSARPSQGRTMESNNYRSHLEQQATERVHQQLENSTMQMRKSNSSLGITLRSQHQQPNNDKLQIEQLENGQDSIMRYLSNNNNDPDASQVVLDMTTNPLNVSQNNKLVNSKCRVDSCTSPKTARFSTLHNQLLKQSRQLNASHSLLNISNVSRENIKQNTKNLHRNVSQMSCLQYQ